jgi:uncharacterized protein
VFSFISFFLGNAGSPLHRLSVFRSLLNACLIPSRSARLSAPSIDYQTLKSDVGVVAVAPRSYWKSTNRTPTEQGLLDDYASTIHYCLCTYPDARVLLYGHSLGGAIATCLLSRLKDPVGTALNEQQYDYSRIRALILENPFSSIPAMVRTLYPQRWLPYHHLAPFAFDRWDAAHAARTAAPQSVLSRVRRETLVLLSERDELVPRCMGEELWTALGQEKDRMVVIKHALHEDAWSRPDWTHTIHNFVGALDSSSLHSNRHDTRT